MGLAQTWLHEGTGAITIDVPVDTPNARAAADSLREIQAMLAAAGVPPRGVDRPPVPSRRSAPAGGDPAELSEDHGGRRPLRPLARGSRPSIKNKSYYDNKPYYNFGCAYQRNMAAMVDNPSDLVQPRPETPAYTARRTAAFEKYRKGTTTTTTYPEADKAKLSDTGK